MDAIKQHLKELGYTDLPDEVLHELAEELLQETLVGDVGVPVPAAAHSDEVKSRPADGAASVSRQALLEQLHLLGYDEQSVPPDVLEELLQELNDAFGVGSAASAAQSVDVSSQETAPARPLFHYDNVDNSPAPFNNVNNNNDFNNNYNAEPVEPSSIPNSYRANANVTNNANSTGQRRFNFDKVRQTVLNQQQRQQQQAQREYESDFENEDGGDEDHVDIAAVKRQSHSQQRNRQQQSSSQFKSTQEAARYLLDIPFQIGLAKHKKSDPLARFNKFKNTWQRDPFLQRTQDPTSRLAKERMFNGIGYHALMGGNQLQAPVTLKNGMKRSNSIPFH